MKLITELNTENIEYITEGTDKDKSLYLSGIFMQSEIQNKNGRIYPKGVMEGALNKYLDTKLNNKTAYGELGHPTGPKINEDRISHLITELKWDGNDVIGKARIFSTEMGNIARAIIEGGGRLGVSSRGLGTLKPNTKGINEVQDDFFIATAADIVTDPSAPAAMVNGIMEGVEYLYDEKNGVFFQQMVEDTKKEIHSLRKSQLDEAKMIEIFTRFIKTL